MKNRNLYDIKELRDLHELEKELYNRGDSTSEIVRKALDYLYDNEIIEDRYAG